MTTHELNCEYSGLPSVMSYEDAGLEIILEEQKKRIRDLKREIEELKTEIRDTETEIAEQKQQP